MRKNTQLFLVIIAVSFLTACAPNEAQYKSQVPVSRPPLEARVTPPVTKEDTVIKEVVPAKTEAKPETTPEEKPPVKADPSSDLPPAINLDVTFFSQAPEGDWGMPWQEACEEASITLAYHYAAEKSLSKEQFKTDVLALVDWENQHFGGYIDTTVDQTIQMIKDYFGFQNVSELKDPTVEDLKRTLSEGHVIVAPFAGRMLKNPFYSGEGPYYHMMVLKGYDSKNFITADVGTKRGQDFIYPYATIMNALHDYNMSDIRLGAKKVIVFE